MRGLQRDVRVGSHEAMLLCPVLGVMQGFL